MVLHGAGDQKSKCRRNMDERIARSIMEGGEAEEKGGEQEGKRSKPVGD